MWEAVECIRPWAVNVAGCVELEGGKGKDLVKVRAFVKAAKRFGVCIPMRGRAFVIRLAPSFVAYIMLKCCL